MTAREALTIAGTRAMDIQGQHNNQSRKALQYLTKALTQENWNARWNHQFKIAIDILSELTD